MGSYLSLLHSNHPDTITNMNTLIFREDSLAGLKQGQILVQYVEMELQPMYAPKGKSYVVEVYEEGKRKLAESHLSLDVANMRARQLSWPGQACSQAYVVLCNRPLL